MYDTEDLDEDEDYDDMEHDYNTGAENVIADYDDYPQYDYDGDYEEGITGSGGPDYGQYYDYDYESRNPGIIDGDFDEGNDKNTVEKDSSLEYNETTNSKKGLDSSRQTLYDKKENDNHEIKKEDSKEEHLTTTIATTTTTTTPTTTTTTTTTESTTTPIPTVATTVSIL